METNEISMHMDAKLDIHGKRPESLKFKTWTRCLVKIEAIKCLPSFLRITLTRSPQLLGVEQKDVEAEQVLPALDAMDEELQLSVSINVPGVSVSQTESRTKPYSYGLFWKQNRRECFIYFAIETETSCRRHMKWIRKSIKNLELHRQVFLEQRRNSRGPGHCFMTDNVNKEGSVKASASTAINTLGPLPQIPYWLDANNSSVWSGTRVSEIYEEIFEQDAQQGPPRLSRRYSRTSIASGIYEEMKPTTAVNFKAIVEEVMAVVDASPPPIPPLPPPRKRINTFETEVGLLGEIPRSNTNPESEMAKKKKYKNMLDSIFGGVARAKRAESVSESVACSVDELLQSDFPTDAVYENLCNNEELLTSATSKRQRQKLQTTKAAVHQMSAESKRNSFSSPDLSKINFLDTFNEEHVAAMLNNSFAHSEELCCSGSLNESSIQRIVGIDQSAELPTKTASHESLNISEQIPVNFNFSACNSSSINLVGASGASLLQTAQKKNKILSEDMTGYCIMAPIPAKKNSVITDVQPTICGISAQSTHCAQSTLSSGYSTGSCYSSSTTSSAISSAAPSCTNSTEHNLTPWIAGVGVGVVQTNEVVTAAAEESAIYENMMCGGSLNSSTATAALYENLLTVKAAQELASTATVAETPTPPAKMSTSTPTGIVADVASPTIAAETDDEGFYQTPRKSIISVDDKVPSYYPNSCETNKQRRRSHSPSKATTPNTLPVSQAAATTNTGLRQLVSVKLRRERKENYYISSPQQILDQRQKAASQSQATKTKSNKLKKTAAHKISEHVYSVSHAHNKKLHHNSNNNNNKDSPSLNNAEAALQAKLQRELLQLAALQNIDFTFDDSKQTPDMLTPSAVDVPQEEAENCFQTKASAMLHKYATIARITPTKSTTPLTTTPTTAAHHHHLQQSQQANTRQLVDASNKQEAAGACVLAAAVADGGLKKFASLPRFKKIDFSPLKLKINNVLQRNQQPQELT